jgi:hypothetical protein
VKRSGSDEAMWVAIHNCMEAAVGISPHSYLYLKLAKHYAFLIHLLCFLFDKIRKQEAKQVLTRSGGWRSGEVAQTMYTHVSKCKNDKIKERKKG